ncbi:MAG: 2,3-bisphosphoglycerate-independent phosphoglycerate mutase [Pyrinomonadaceae bacterium MAG19_C2-C3]|nr:2,3-bisphosphoglycerate-independent phosphoglycerate mutase [Pyrinomonadaceae bacterium MAG19_C2-C3]
MNKHKSPLALLILDGWGYREDTEGNAIRLAATPFYDGVLEKYPMTLLEASGRRVGLPAGVMGNSEVGHLNIGSGRVIRTDIGRIDYAIESGELFTDATLVNLMNGARERDRALHLIGLVSDGKVHSSQDHLHALLDMARRQGLTRVYVHAFLDGRDTPPMSALGFIAALQNKCAEVGCASIASVVGRFYAMDRDKRWERTVAAYNLLTRGTGEPITDPLTGICQMYERGTTDEFITPLVVTRESGEPLATIQDGDAVLHFNYRADRARQLTNALTQASFDGFAISNRPRLDYVCLTQYDKTFNLPFVFAPETRPNILAEVFARHELNNYRLAETEKYAHVTYFFNGGTEKEFACESRLLVPSQKVTTYDLAPEMSAYKITDKVLRTMDAGETDVFIINFANADMVGHSGKLDKTIEAVQHVDTCLGWIMKAVRAHRGRLLVTADHGNAEMMIDPNTGGAHTAHTTNLVPFHFIDDNAQNLTLRDGGALEDIAPTILRALGVEQPTEMTGRDLCEA